MGPRAACREGKGRIVVARRPPDCHQTVRLGQWSAAGRRHGSVMIMTDLRSRSSLLLRGSACECLVVSALLPNPGDEPGAAADEELVAGEVLGIWVIEQTKVGDDHQVFQIRGAQDSCLARQLIGHGHDPLDR